MLTELADVRVDFLLLVYFSLPVLSFTCCVRVEIIVCCRCSAINGSSLALLAYQMRTHDLNPEQQQHAKPCPFTVNHVYESTAQERRRGAHAGAASRPQGSRRDNSATAKTEQNEDDGAATGAHRSRAGRESSTRPCCVKSAIESNFVSQQARGLQSRRAVRDLAPEAAIADHRTRRRGCK
jgi:hypothetical protein